MIRQYPDPDSVVYPTAYPPQFPCRMSTRTPNASRVYPIHWHGCWVNAQGNGATDADSGHSHVIRGGIVLPDSRDGHTHQITILPCGVG